MGKLQLTSDMTELEFALSALMVVEDVTSQSGPGAKNSKQANRQSLRRPVAKLETIGDDYKTLRGLRCVFSSFNTLSYDNVH